MANNSALPLNNFYQNCVVCIYYEWLMVIDYIVPTLVPVR